MDNIDFDTKTSEEQKRIDERNERFSIFKHTEDIVGVSYSILRSLCLIAITVSATYSIVGLGIRKWLSSIITVLNELEWSTALLIIYLYLIYLGSKTIKTIITTRKLK